MEGISCFCGLSVPTGIGFMWVWNFGSLIASLLSAVTVGIILGKKQYNAFSVLRYGFANYATIDSYDPNVEYDFDVTKVKSPDPNVVTWMWIAFVSLIIDAGLRMKVN